LPTPGDAPEVEVGVFDDEMQPHVPMINAAMMVTANASGFISLLLNKHNKYATEFQCGLNVLGGVQSVCTLSLMYYTHMARIVKGEW
jgi:hypothetical protein